MRQFRSSWVDGVCQKGARSPALIETFQLAIIIFYSVIIFPLQDFCMTPRSSFVHRSLSTSFSSLMVVYAADSEQTC